jgi:hypothetical protein
LGYECKDIYTSLSADCVPFFLSTKGDDQFLDRLIHDPIHKNLQIAPGFTNRMTALGTARNDRKARVKTWSPARACGEKNEVPICFFQILSFKL